MHPWPERTPAGNAGGKPQQRTRRPLKKDTGFAPASPDNADSNPNKVTTLRAANGAPVHVEPAPELGRPTGASTGHADNLTSESRHPRMPFGNMPATARAAVRRSEPLGPGNQTGTTAGPLRPPGQWWACGSSGVLRPGQLLCNKGAAGAEIVAGSSCHDLSRRARDSNFRSMTGMQGPFRKLSRPSAGNTHPWGLFPMYISAD